MSSIAIASSVSAALPAVNVKPHGRGHKKGSEVDPSDSTTSSTAAQVPVGSAQSLFGNAFNALEQLVGLQPPSAASLAAPSSPAAPTNSTAASVAAAGSKINLFA
jgi:hypothetical protein